MNTADKIENLHNLHHDFRSNFLNSKGHEREIQLLSNSVMECIDLIKKNKLNIDHFLESMKLDRDRISPLNEFMIYAYEFLIEKMEKILRTDPK